MTNFLQRRKEQLYTPIKAVGRTASLFSPAVNAATTVGSLFSYPARKPQQNQSVVQASTNQPQMSAGRPTIQGSGYSSNYASNPTNYKPKTTTPPPTQTANPMAQYNTRIDDYFKRMSDQSASRVAQEEANRQKEQEFLDKRYGLMNDTIKGSIPTLNNNFNTFKTNTEAGVQDVLAQAEDQKEQTRDYFGEANRTAAQARGETQAQARQKFAGQGAIDSAGAGSYVQANENIDSDFNRYVQKNSKEMAYKLTDIDSAVGEYQRQASTLIQTEEAKLQESLREIEYTLADNEIAKAQAMNEANRASQTRIQTIQDTLSAIEQQAITQKNTIQMELDKLAQTSFTPEFMATGVPTKQAEYEFMVTNADKYKELGIFGGGQSGANQDKALRMVENLLGADTNTITGAVRSGNVPMVSSWSGSAQTQADYDGLRNLLALAERGQLKGSGAVSDFEAKMLEKAAMAGLNQNLSDTEFRRRLEVLKNDLMMGGATNTQYGGQQNNDPLGIL